MLNDNDTFYRANKQDETSAGIPVADIYSADGGITVGDASATRRSLQTPVAEKDGTVYAAIQRPSRTVGAREKLAAGEGFVEVHGGDYYVGLRGYAEGMRRIGFQTLDREEIPESSYDLRWESWGWEFDAGEASERRRGHENADRCDPCKGHDGAALVASL